LKVYEVHDNGIMCILGGGVQGEYQVNVMKLGYGYALINDLNANLFKFEIRVTDFYPKEVQPLIFLWLFCLDGNICWQQVNNNRYWI